MLSELNFYDICLQLNPKITWNQCLSLYCEFLYKKEPQGENQREEDLRKRLERLEKEKGGGGMEKDGWKNAIQENDEDQKSEKSQVREM